MMPTVCSGGKQRTLIGSAVVLGRSLVSCLWARKLYNYLQWVLVSRMVLVLMLRLTLVVYIRLALRPVLILGVARVLVLT